MNEIVAAFEAAKKRAADTPTWRLKLRVKRLRRRARNTTPTEIERAQLIAVEHVLRHRMGTTPLGQCRPA